MWSAIKFIGYTENEQPDYPLRKLHFIPIPIFKGEMCLLALFASARSGLGCSVVFSLFSTRREAHPMVPASSALMYVSIVNPQGTFQI